MPFPDAEMNAALNTLVGRLDYAALHSTYSTSGGGELTTGAPASRFDATTKFTTASAGVAQNKTDFTLNVPTGTTARWLGFWSASTAGTFRGMIPLGTKALLGVAHTDDYVYVDGHGLSNSQSVTVTAGRGDGVMPSGLAEGAVYYVTNREGDRFQVSTGAGTGAIDITAAGDVIVSDISALTSTGTLTLSTGTVKIAGLG